ncbi:Nudix hydrolase 15 [Ranunculus cassubicifolius]
MDFTLMDSSSSKEGFAESSTRIVRPERFKPEKTAVLICLFEDDDGVLRAISTKRSSKRSTHSGEVSLLSHGGSI